MLFREYFSSLANQASQSAWMNVRARLRLIIDVLIENKEFVLGPAITVVPQLFSLPLLISSFIFDCHNLEDSWLRYFLIVSYWISFTPQWTTFFLYIVPSSLYSNEWHQTNVGRWINNLRRRHALPSTAVTTRVTGLSSMGNKLKDKP
jgi:intracellular septation protein A